MDNAEFILRMESKIQELICFEVDWASFYELLKD
jgi:hypothetical protein